MNLKSRVEQKIASDLVYAKTQALRVQSDSKSFEDDSILEFFGDMQSSIGERLNVSKDLARGSWVRWARSSHLVHNILFNGPVLLDLKPLNESEFRSHYGISSKTATLLAERGCLIPNLYIRDPLLWARDDHMHLSRLIDLSYVNGVRVDTFLEMKDSSYESQKSGRTSELRSILQNFSESNREALIAYASRVSDTAVYNNPNQEIVEQFARSSGPRWAYLDVMRKQAANDVQEKFQAGKVIEGLEDIRVLKHLVISPISAAVGGRFFWSDDEWAALQARIDFMDFGHDLEPNVRRPIREDMTLDAFLLNEMVGSAPLPIVGSYDTLGDEQERNLLKLLSETPLLELNIAISDLEKKILTWIRKEVSKPSSLEDLKMLVRERNEILYKWQRIGQIGLASVIFMLLDPLTVLQDALEGQIKIADAGIAINILYVGSRIGSFGHLVARPNDHRALKMLNQIRPD